MALQKQIVEWRAGAGIDSKTETKIVDTNVVGLENAVFVKGQSVQKRPGTTTIGATYRVPNTVPSTSSAATQSTGVMLYDSELLQAVNFNRLASYSSKASSVIDKGAYTNTSLSTEGIYGTADNFVYCDAATLNGITVYAFKNAENAQSFTSYQGVYVAVVDEATKDFIWNPLYVGPVTTPVQVIINNNKIYAFYLSSAVGTLECLEFDPSTPYNRNKYTALTPNGVNDHFDVAVGNGLFYVAYLYGPGTANLVALTSGLVIGNGSNGAPAPITSGIGTGTFFNCLNIFYNSDQIRIIYQTDTLAMHTVGIYTDMHAVIYDTVTLPHASLSSVVRAVTGYLSASGFIVYYSVVAATATASYTSYVLIDSSGTAILGGLFCKSVVLVSRLFFYNSVGYFLTQHLTSTIDNLQSTYFVMNLDSQVVGRANTGIAGNSVLNALPNVTAITSSSFLIPTLTKGTLQSSNGALFSSSNPSRISFSFNSSTPSFSQLGENLHIAGATLRDYDGFNVVEHGFNLFPEAMTSAVSVSVGSLSVGSYQYVAVYEWTDAKGQIHQSTPSVPITQVLIGGQTAVDLHLPILYLTDKPNISVVIYRTAANGTLFYRATPVDSYLINGVATTYTDLLSDILLQNNQLLYTTGGVLSNDVPDSISCITSYNNRLWAVTDQANQVIYSKTYSLGQAVGFSDYLNLQVGVKGGKVVGLAVLDDKLIIFKDKSIFFITGNGPTNTGDSNDLTSPQLIPSDVGLKDVASIVLTPAGLMFNSSKGIHLLDHNLAVSYIGAPVEAFLTSSVNSAVLIESNKEVRFLLDSSTLVYNYYFQQWSIFTYGGVGSVNWQGSYVVANATGGMKQETTSYVDDGSNYTTKIITPWFKLGSLQGYGRLWKIFLLGNWKSSHTLNVTVAYNYNTTVVDTFTITNTTTPGVYQFRMDPSNQLCESFQLTITDTSGAQSFTLEGLTFEIGARDGGFRINQSKVY